MLDFLEQIPAEWRPIALLIFITVGAVGAALTYLRGKKAGPEQPKVQEFYAAGQLADMSPVKELTGQLNVVAIQMQRNEAALGSLSATDGPLRDLIASHARIDQSLGVLADLLGQHLADMRDEREEREDQAREEAAEQRGFERGLKARRPPSRRPAKRKAAAS